MRSLGRYSARPCGIGSRRSPSMPTTRIPAHPPRPLDPKSPVWRRVGGRHCASTSPMSAETAQHARPGGTGVRHRARCGMQPTSISSLVGWRPCSKPEARRLLDNRGMRLTPTRDHRPRSLPGREHGNPAHPREGPHTPRAGAEHPLPRPAPACGPSVFDYDGV